MEPLNEGKVVLKSEKLSVRMNELAGMIHEEHVKVNAAWRSALEHARNAGEWLIEAKWRKGHRSKWGRWKRRLAKEYGIAERTMSQYMQIARHWEHRRIKAARAEGFTIESIGTFVQCSEAVSRERKSSTILREAIVRQKRQILMDQRPRS